MASLHRMLGGQRLQGLWGGARRPRGRHPSVHTALSATLPQGPVLSQGSLTQPTHGASTRRLFSRLEAGACDPAVLQAWAPSRGCRSHPCPDFMPLLPRLRLLVSNLPHFLLSGLWPLGRGPPGRPGVIPPSKDTSCHVYNEVPSQGWVGEDIGGPSTGPGTESGSRVSHRRRGVEVLHRYSGDPSRRLVTCGG